MDPVDPQRYQIFPQEENRADVGGGGKRKLPSPEGVVRQAALPQPQTGKERRGQDEEEEEQQRLTRQGVAMQNSERHTPQEWQEEGQYPDSQKSRAISGGKNSRE